MTRVRLARSADVAAMSAVLGTAFSTDPMMEWLFTDGATRTVLTTSWMRISTELSLERGHAFVAVGDGGDIEGAALWSPPDVDLYGPAGFRPLWSLVIGANAHRLDVVQPGLRALGAAHPGDEGHYYLNSIGVDPARRSSGVGALLLERVLRDADHDGVPAYLESSNARNVPFYERHGFEVVDEIALPGGPVARPMWRTPR